MSSPNNSDQNLEGTALEDSKASIEPGEDFTDPLKLAPVSEDPVEPSREMRFYAPKVNISRSPIEPRIKGDKRPPVSLLRVSDLEAEIALKNSPNFDPTMGKQGTQWLNAINLADKTKMRKNLFVKAIESEASSWNQFVPYEGKNISASTTEFEIPTGNSQKLSGEKAVLRVRALLGSGEQRRIPLFGSGIWVTFKPVSDDQLSNLETIINLSKEHIGRLTGSIALSNTMVYLAMHFFNFCVENIADCNIVDNDLDQLRSLVLVSDLQHMAVGLAQTIFPKGYPLLQPCVINPATCQFTEELNLNLRAAVIHDETKLTVKQRAHMADPTRKYTVAQIKAYQAEGPVLESEIISLQDGAVKVAFKTPTMEEYINDGNHWIDGISTLIDKIMADEDNPQTRARLIEDQARLTTLRQYGHFIKHVIIQDNAKGDKIIDDQETLGYIINDLSADADILDEILAGVRDQIERATISVVATPKSRCPGCQGAPTPEELKHPAMVPIDALSLFFTLLSLKLVQRQRTGLTVI